MRAHERDDASTQLGLLHFQLIVFGIAAVAFTIAAPLDHGVWHILSAAVFLVDVVLSARRYRRAR